MTYKWNLAEAQQYAKNFSQLICDEYFKDHQTITGSDILKLTEIKQLNLMVVRCMYEKWQEESKRLQSPFFDYDNEEVKKAYTDFMNILSRYISVKRDHFEPHLGQAVKATLFLNADPKAFFEEQMRNLPDFKLTAEWLQRNGRYFSSYAWVLKELLDRLNGLPFVYANQAIDWIKDIFENNKQDKDNKDLEAFDKILRLNKETIEAPAPASFFDLPFETIEKPVQIARSVPEEVNSFNEVLPENEIILPVTNPVIVAIEEEIPVFDKQEEKINAYSLNDKHLGTNSTLNDKLPVETATLQDKHSKAKIDNIRSAISLNQRFLFINNLFGGDVQTFSQALDELETCGSFASAKEQMVKKYLPKYKWNISSAEAEEFFDILKRKFNS